MVLPWLLNSLDVDLLGSVVYSDLAIDVWNDLKEGFSQSNGTRLFQIKHSIAS